MGTRRLLIGVVMSWPREDASSRHAGRNMYCKNLKLSLPQKPWQPIRYSSDSCTEPRAFNNSSGRTDNSRRKYVMQHRSNRRGQARPAIINQDEPTLSLAAIDWWRLLGYLKP